MENQWVNEMSMMDILTQHLVGKYIQIYSSISGYSTTQWAGSTSYTVKVIEAQEDYEGINLTVQLNESYIDLHIYLNTPLQIIGS